MAVPTRKQVAKHVKMEQMWKEMNKKVETKSEPISEEEHERRLKMLKEIGLIKE